MEASGANQACETAAAGEAEFFQPEDTTKMGVQPNRLDQACGIDQPNWSEIFRPEERQTVDGGAEDTLPWGRVALWFHWLINLVSSLKSQLV